MADLNSITSLRDVLTNDEKEKKTREIRARIVNDTRLQEILNSFEGMTDSTLERSYAPILRYLDDKKICENCKKFDECPKKSRPGHRIALHYDPFMDQIYDGYVKCKYLRDIQTYLSKFIASDYDLMKNREVANEAYMNLKLSRSNIENGFNSVSKKHIALVTKFSKSQFNYGGYITCKNQNAEALLFLLSNLYAKKGFTVAILDASKTLTDCSSFDKYIKAEATEKLEKAKLADALFITNLGFEYKSQAAKDLVLTPLLFARNKEGFVTYFSSYMTIEELAVAYARDKVTREMLVDLIKKICNQDKIEDIELFTK